MKKKTIYLHIGTFKTGTSAIQEYCHNHSELLQSAGYHYIKCNRPVNNSTNHGLLSLSLYSENGGHPPGWFVDDADFDSQATECLREINQSKCHSFIISSEEFWRFASHDNGKKAIENLCGKFAGHNIKVVLYARPPFDFCKSWYNQVIKGQSEVKPFMDFVLRLDASFVCPNANTNLWGSVVGAKNLIILNYFHRGAEHINQFLKSIGCSALCSESEIRGPVNIGLPLGQIEKRRFRLIYEKHKEKDILSSKLISKVLSDRALWRLFNERVINFNQQYAEFCNKYLPNTKNEDDNIFHYLAFHYKIQSLFTVDIALEGRMNDADIDQLRDIAISLEQTKPKLAYQLLRIALKQRPHGPLLIRKVQELEANLSVSDKQ